MRITFVAVFLALVIGCGDQRSELDLAVRKGLDSGIRADSLFLGVHLGMSKKEFYDHCWDLNRKELVKEGQANQSVLYLFDDEEGNQVALNFYADFLSDGTVYEIDTSFRYYAWAPWNKHLQSDKMLEYLPELFDKWYGPAPVFKEQTENGEVWYRIDGNRRIEMRIHDEMYVKVKFTDMTLLPRKL